MSAPTIETTRARLATVGFEEIVHVNWVLDFLENEDKSEEDKMDMIRILTARIEREPWVFRDPVDDMEERLSLLNSVLEALHTASPENCHNREAIAWAHAFLSLLSISVLRSFRDDPARLVQVCPSIRPFTTAINKGTGLGRDPVQGNERSRNADASDETKERDGCCILSFKRGILHACYIIAFGATKSQWVLDMLRQHWCVAECLFDDDREFLDFLRRLIFRAPGNIDVAINMITLNGYMHEHWDDSFFGLKVIGIDGGLRVQVQYVQLYTTDTRRTRRKFTQKDLIDPPERSEYQQRFDEFFEYNGKTGRRIQNGDIFTITCRSIVEALHMSYLLKLRWATTQLQFLAGAAGVHMDEKEEEDWTEPGYLTSLQRYADPEP